MRLQRAFLLNPLYAGSTNRKVLWLSVASPYVPQLRGGQDDTLETDVDQGVRQSKLRTLALALVLCVTGFGATWVQVPLAAAQGAGTFTVTPKSGPPGTAITLTAITPCFPTSINSGGNGGSTGYIGIIILNAPSQPEGKFVNFPTSGIWSATLSVPLNEQPGTYPIVVDITSSGQCPTYTSQNFTVTAGGSNAQGTALRFSVSPSDVQAGSLVTLTSIDPCPAPNGAANRSLQAVSFNFGFIDRGTYNFIQGWSIGPTLPPSKVDWMKLDGQWSYQFSMPALGPFGGGYGGNGVDAGKSVVIEPGKYYFSAWCGTADATHTADYVTQFVTLGAASPSNQTCHVNVAPRVVVVMLMGLDSWLPSGNPYDVRSINYCDIAQSQNAQLAQLGATFDTQGAGTNKAETLAGNLGGQQGGGVLLLPYSYNGAYFVGPYRFFAAGYSSQDPNASDVIADAWVLDNELISIRNQWPNVNIVIVGHSLGGLIAKQWWRNWDGQHSAPDHARRSWHISAVFSLDGPINGGPLENYQWTPNGNCPVVPGFNQLPCGLLAQQFAALWDDYALKGDDTQMARVDSGDRGIFTPVGTYGDVIMETLRGPVGINDNGEELGVQLFAAFNSDGTVQTLLNPGVVTAQDAHFWQGIGSSHQLVLRDSGNIDMISRAVASAAVSSAPATQTAFALTASYSSLILRPHPSATVATRVVARAGTVKILGARLGRTPGSIWLVGQKGTKQRCPVRTWTNARVTCQLPRGSSSGEVVVQSHSGLTALAGSILIPPVSRVISLRMSISKPAVIGLPETVTVTGQGLGSIPARGASVSALLGQEVVRLTLDSRGKAFFKVAGRGQLSLLVASGRAVASITARWVPSPIRFAKISGPSSVTIGTTVSLSVVAEGTHGVPMAHASLFCSITGPAEVTGVGHRVCTTNHAGRVRLVTSSRSPAQVVVSVSNSDGRNLGVKLIAWTNRSGREVSGSSIPLVLLAVGASFVLAYVVAMYMWRKRKTSAVD